MRRAALVVAAALVVGGCYSGEQKPGPHDGSSLDFKITQTVVVDDAGFHPNDVATRLGAAITVTNRGTHDHTLSSDSIDTGTLKPGESTTVFFTALATIEAHDRDDLSHTVRILVGAES